LPPYDKDGNPYPPVKEETGCHPAGDVLTTVEDYCRFGVDVINGAGISGVIYQDMIRPHVAVLEADGLSLSRGLGWVLVKDMSTGEYALAHGGSEEGIRTFVVLLPVTRRGLVVLTNGDTGIEVYKRIIMASLEVGKELVERLAL
jgi:CubicO group peptidase (beta-lactamase class C family)